MQLGRAMRLGKEIRVVLRRAKSDRSPSVVLCIACLWCAECFSLVAVSTWQIPWSLVSRSIQLFVGTYTIVRVARAQFTDYPAFLKLDKMTEPTACRSRFNLHCIWYMNIGKTI